MVFTDCLKQGEAITDKHHATLLDLLRDAIKVKLHIWSTKVVFLQNNSPVHKFAPVAAKLYDKRFEVLPHALYSSNLVFSVYFLFPNLQKLLAA